MADFCASPASVFRGDLADYGPIAPPCPRAIAVTKRSCSTLAIGMGTAVHRLPAHNRTSFQSQRQCKSDVSCLPQRLAHRRSCTLAR